MQHILLLLAILGRLLPHPANMTPVGAVALVGGSKCSGFFRWATPLVALVFSDILLKVFFNTTPFSIVTPFIYGSFAINIFLGSRIGTQKRYARLGIFSLIGSLQFFLLTNLGVWIEGMLYAPTATGLAQCYAMALPFLKNTLIGDMGWSFGLFLIIERVTLWTKNRSLALSYSTQR